VAFLHKSKDGIDALGLVEECHRANRPVNILISDLTIPGSMGGKELVSILRERGEKFKAIVISGYSSDPVISEYRKFGFDAYLVKPFSATDLLQAVRGLAGE